MTDNILILTTPFRPNIGGVETHLDDLIETGTKSGYKFLVLTYQPLITKAIGNTVEKGNGFTIYRLPWIRMNLFLILEKFPLFEFIYLFPGLFLFGLFFLLLNASRINIIHAQGLVAGAVGVFLGKIFQKQVIISTHSIYNFPKKGFYPLFVKYLFQNCKQVLTLSKQSKEEVLSLGIPKDRVSIFTYWINQTTFRVMDKTKLRRKLGLENRFICLFVGRLVSGKGVEELLEATIQIPEVSFLIVGDGPLKDEVIKLQTNKNIIFVGRIDNNELPIYYNVADVLIVPSTHEEGFGRVILEALSCGLPIIASDRGGIKEAINSRVAKLITISPTNIKEALEYFLKNRLKLEVLASNAKGYARKYFSDKNAQMILKYYG